MYRNFQKRTRFHDQSARFRQWYNNIAHSSRRIFQAKCNDMCMPISARREELFIQTVLEFCVNSSFSVQDSGLGPLAAREIARFMRKQYVLSQQKNNTFTHLNLGGNSLGDEGVHCLTHMLRKNLHLTTLDLHSNACSSIGFASVFDALTHDNHTLTTLDISATSTKNKMYIGPGITGVLALKRMLIHNNNLTTLNIANVGLGLIPGGMQLVSDGLAMNKTLTNLDLSMNNINHYEVNILTKGIKKAEASMLQSLTLRGNKLGSLGASHVANLLR